MGLDIYMFATADKEKYQAFEKIKDDIEKKTEELWDNAGKKYDDMRENEREEIREKVKKLENEEYTNHGFIKGDYGWDNPYELGVEKKSKKHPRHYWKIGYFRSSYNESGINHFLGDRLGYDLYYIFGQDVSNPEYEFFPDWEAVKKRATKALKEVNKYIENYGNYGVMKSGWNEFNGLPKDHPVKTPEDALKVFNEERASHIKTPRLSSEYSNIKGDFFLSNRPLKVAALIHGVERRLFVDEYIPVTYVVFKQDGKSPYKYYTDSLEILIETCDFALADKNNTYFVHWSS